MSDQVERDQAERDQTERDQLIAAAVEAGVPTPHFKSNEDLRAAIEAAGGETTRSAAAGVETQAKAEVQAGTHAEGPPAEGADAADPYAHLGSDAPTGDKETVDEEA